MPGGGVVTSFGKAGRRRAWLVHPVDKQDMLDICRLYVTDKAYLVSVK
jgi:hypothetical protein